MSLYKDLGLQNLAWTPVLRPFDTVKALSIVALSLLVIFLVLLFMGWNQIHWHGGKIQSVSGPASWAFSLILPVAFFNGFSILTFFLTVRAIAIEEEILFIKYSLNRVDSVRWAGIEEIDADLSRMKITDISGNPIKVAWVRIKLGHKSWLSIDIDASAAEKIVAIYEKNTGRKYVGSLNPDGSVKAP